MTSPPDVQNVTPPADLPVMPLMNLDQLQYDAITAWRDACVLAARAERDAEIERHQKKWQDYERDFILPCFKWAEEIGFDLKAAVAEAKGNCVERLVEHLRARVKELEQLATPAVVESFFGLNNRAMRAEKARDIAEARAKELEEANISNEELFDTLRAQVKELEQSAEVHARNMRDLIAEHVRERDALQAHVEELENAEYYAGIGADFESMKRERDALRTQLAHAEDVIRKARAI